MSKVNYENELYEQWQNSAEESKFSLLWERLRPCLLLHARAVCKNALRQVDETLVEEMVDDLLLEIDQFEARWNETYQRFSTFSTWAHARFLYGSYAELRYRQKNLGEPLVEDLSEAASPELELLSRTEVQQRLSPTQQRLVQARLDGYTFEAIGVDMGMNKQAVHRMWKQALEEFADK